MSEQDAKGRKPGQAYVAGALFCLAGLICVADGFRLGHRDTVASKVPQHMEMVAVGALFLCLGALWLAIGTRWMKRAERE